MKPAPALTTIIQNLLGRRLLLVGLLIVLVIAVLLGYFRYHEIRSEQRLQAASIAAYVESHIQFQMQTMSFLSTVMHYPEFEAIASYYKRHTGLFQRFLVLDEAGRIRQVIPHMEAFRDFSRMLPELDMHETPGRFYFSIPYVNPDEHSITVSLAYTSHIGRILAAELDLYALQDFIHRLTGLKEDDLVFVLDRYGNVLAHPDAGYVATQSNLGHLDTVAKAVNGQTGFLGLGRKQGGFYLFSAETIPGPEWKVFTGWSVKSQLIPVLTPIAFAGFLLFIFLSLMVWNVTKRIRQDVISPLSSFSGEVRNLPRGTFDIGVNKYVSSFSELQVLSQSFQDMAETIVRREESLRKSEQRLASILDSLDAAVYVTDMQSHELLFINRYIRENKGDVLGRKCWEVFQDKQEGPCSLCNLNELVDEQGGSIGVVRREYQETGTGTYYDCRSMAIPWSDGRMVRIEISTDITQRKTMEARLNQANKMEAVGTLAGGIAHDFNNILQVITGHAGMLLKKSTGNDPDYKRVLHIQQSADRGAGLVRQLLAFSREMEIQFQPVDLNSEAVNITSLLRQTFAQKHDIQLDLDDTIMPVAADPAQIEQVLLNLCNNALDAMPEGGSLVIRTANISMEAPLDIGYTQVLPGQYALLEVSDTGTGIDEEIRSKIFDPFFTTKEIGKGTGLGLSSVYGIVKRHNGYIECRSQPGKGSTFRIYIPASHKSHKDLRHEEQEKTSGGSEHILVVDDEPSLRELTREALEEAGYRVSSVDSGEKALELFQKQGRDIHLIIMDINMPGMGGLACIDKLLQLDPGTKILVVSGYSPGEGLSKYLSSGRAEFMAKPYRVPELLSRIREIIDPGFGTDSRL
ncbi:ATP-binding protein [Desulfonatronospira sp.]|uniref:ATP-binding protein n=1 Tax=Desulfonatronospira sp. TaxID=1962951 RepID=UPI0025C547AD|nr:ATP-binding protein [Desulfonatronospira sp.]